MQKEIEDIQQPLMELVVAPSVESRPSTPPPQPGNRTREMPLSVCRLPVRKGANLVRKPLRPVRRRLFDPPSPAEVEDFLSGLEQRDQRRFIDRFEILILLTLPFLTDIFWVHMRVLLSVSYSHSCLVYADTTSTLSRMNPCLDASNGSPWGHSSQELQALILAMK